MIMNGDAHLNGEEVLAAAEGESLSDDLQRHVNSCALCTNEIAAVQKTFSVLHGTPEPSLSPRLRRDLLRNYRSKGRKRRPVRRLLSRRIPVYQAACLMAGAILAWEVVTPRSEASHHSGELFGEVPAFAAAMPEFVTSEYSIGTETEVSSSSVQSGGTALNDVNSNQRPVRWEEPSVRETPGIDSCDVDAE